LDSWNSQLATFIIAANHTLSYLCSLWAVDGERERGYFKGPYMIKYWGQSPPQVV